MIRNLIRKSSSLNFSTKKRSPIIGIDLGTTNSCVAIMENSKPKIIENSQGMRTTPSVIAFTKDDEVLIGSAAKRQAIINSQKTIYAIKRLLGRRFDQDCVKNFRQDFPYQIIKHQNGDAWIRVKDNNYSPSEISAFILKKMKETVENYLGESVQRAVITVPAYFNDSQRQATIDAGKIAGFHVQRILNEPTAAAMAYGISKKQLDQTIAVYDLGGGTFDISILQISHGVIEVKASNGDTTCGGQDVDTILQKYLLEEFRKISGVDSSQDKAVIQRLREACQRAKKQLSHITQTQINLPFLTSNASGPKHFTYKLTRAKFQSLIEDFLKRTIKPCEQCIRDSQIRINQINEVILVGGMTKMPKVQKLVQKFFGKAPKMSINPDEAVAIGAAIQGGVLMGDFRDLLLIDITPLSLGIQTLGGYMTKIIGKNTTIPAKKSRIFTTAFDNQSKVSIKIYQGQKERVEQNKLLGQFSLRGIEPAPRGTPQIEVTFDIDSNGIVHVGAKDIKTGVTQKAIIENSGNMSEQQINKIIKRFQDIKKGENQRKDLQKLKQQLQFVYQIGKCRLNELKFHVPSEEFSIAKDTFERLGDWRKKNLKLTDIEQLKKLVQQLKVFTEKYLRKQGIKKMQSS